MYSTVYTVYLSELLLLVCSNTRSLFFSKACDFAVAFEEYLEKCPQTIVMDPVLGVHTLIRRTATYALLKEVTKNDGDLFLN